MVTLVDDEANVLSMLGCAMERWGHPCQSARSAEEAMALLEARPTPLVVTDLHMAGQGGLWLVQEVRRRWPGIGIIVMTGGHDMDATVACLNAGAHRYFFKPINLEDFRHALESTLETFRLRKERAQYHRRLEARVRQRTRQVRATFLAAVDSLVLALEARDPYTAGHSGRVRRYALRLGRALGLSSRELRQAALAARMHDIGKVGVPESVLHKASGLTEAEQRIIEAHPVIGESILKPIVRNREVLSAIRGHHERMDGRGYPDRLAAGNIPFLARLIAVADCFDALTSSRPYRKAMSPHQARDVLAKAAGAQLDPELVQAFLPLVAVTSELLEPAEM